MEWWNSGMSNIPSGLEANWGEALKFDVTLDNENPPFIPKT